MASDEQVSEESLTQAAGAVPAPPSSITGGQPVASALSDRTVQRRTHVDQMDVHRTLTGFAASGLPACADLNSCVIFERPSAFFCPPCRQLCCGERPPLCGSAFGEPNAGVLVVRKTVCLPAVSAAAADSPVGFYPFFSQFCNTAFAAVSCLWPCACRPASGVHPRFLLPTRLRSRGSVRAGKTQRPPDGMDRAQNPLGAPCPQEAPPAARMPFTGMSNARSVARQIQNLNEGFRDVSAH